MDVGSQYIYSRKKRPLVVEDERLNFLDEKENENEADDKEAEDGCKNQKAE